MRKGATNWVMIGIFIFALAVMTGYITIEGLKPAVPPTEPPVPPGFVCESTVTPDLDINYYRHGTPSTAETGAVNLYRKVGEIAWTTWTMGTAITGLEPFATYEFLPGVSTTVATSDAETFGEYFQYTIKCQETETLNKEGKLDETYDGLTGTFYNDDDNAAGVDFTAGATKIVSIKWKAAKDEFYGNPHIATSPLADNGKHSKKYPNVLALKLNSTAWEVPVAVTFTTTTGGSGTLDRIPCPTIVSADGATTHITYCYEAPVITMATTRFWLNVEADGTNAPTVDDTAYLYAGQFYIDTDTAGIGWGIENNDAAYTGGDGDADEVTLDWTA